MTNYSQRYATGDSNTAGSFTFDTDGSGGDVPVSKIVFGADAAAYTRVTASVGLPVQLLAGTAAFGKLAANSGVTIGAVEIASAQTLATVTTVSTVTNLSQLGGAAIAMGTGVRSAGTQRVTIATDDIVPVSQSGTWTIQPGNTANTTAWLVTGTGGTFPVTDSGGSLTVDAPVGTPVFVRLSDGASAISTLPVSLASVPSHAVTNAGTFAVQVDGTALTRLTDIETNTDSLAIVGNGAAATAQRVTISNDSTGILAGVTTLTGSGVAHDAADSGNPHKIGAKATTALSGVTLVADADRTDARSAADGALLVRDICLEDVVQERTTNTDGASTAFASGLAAPGAGVRLWITKVTIANSSASFCTVDLRDGAAGSVLWTLPVPATGGVVERFDPPLKLTANTALAFDASAATTTLSISANGFKSKL